MREAIVIVNRRARHLEASSEPLLALFRKYHAIETHDLEGLDVAMMDVRAHKPEVVILAGGDGSYSAGVSALAKAYGAEPLPVIGLAPGGTVSTVARNFGLSGDLVPYAERLLASVAAGHTSERPTLRIGERIGFIFGAGLVARFFEVYEAEGKGGNAGAAKIVARVFAGSVTGGRLAKRVLEPVPCEIEVDGEKAPFDKVSLVAASTVKDLGLHMHLLYRAAEETDAFHVVATPLGPAKLGPQLPRVVMGRSLLGERIDRLAKSVKLRFPERDGAWVLDGDLYRSDEIEIVPGPVLKILQAT